VFYGLLISKEMLLMFINKRNLLLNEDTLNYIHIYPYKYTQFSLNKKYAQKIWLREGSYSYSRGGGSLFDGMVNLRYYRIYGNKFRRPQRVGFFICLFFRRVWGIFEGGGGGGNIV